MKLPFLFTCQWGIRLEHLFLPSEPEKEEEKGKRSKAHMLCTSDIGLGMRESKL